jgi:hypothetical protein
LILRAAKDEGATSNVVTDSFFRALESVYGPNPLSGPATKLSWRRTARAMAKSKEAWNKPDRAALANLKLSRKERGLHNSFGEAL